jgi:hypothetical protein
MTEMSAPFARSAGSSLAPALSTAQETNTLRQHFPWLRSEGAMTVSVPSRARVAVEVIDQERGAALFDRRVRALLGISAEAFLAHYDAGDAWDVYDHGAVSQLSMLVPFAR